MHGCSKTSTAYVFRSTVYRQRSVFLDYLSCTMIVMWTIGFRILFPLR